MATNLALILPSRFVFSLSDSENKEDEYIPLFFKEWIHKFVTIPRRFGISKRGNTFLLIAFY